MKFLLCLALFLGFTTSCFATPSQIVVIRHGDKIDHQGKETGPALDPTGYVRAIKFAYYYINTFGEPDIIVATNPNNKNVYVKSIREIQTIAPLANILQERHGKVLYKIYDPYPAKDETQLSQYVLHDPAFDHKTVLICWEHHRIPRLIQTLGVTQAQPEWPSDDFDSVYVLHFNAEGTLVNYSLLHHQYPVKPIESWQTLAAKFA